DRRTSRETHAERSAEVVEEVADTDVERLAEDTVRARFKRDDLRVRAARVEEDGIVYPTEDATDFEVRYAVIDRDERLAVSQGEASCECRADTEAVADTGRLTKRDEVDVADDDMRFLERLLEDSTAVFDMVFCDFRRDHTRIRAREGFPDVAPEDPT